MFKKSKKGYYFWEEFSELGVVNGFSTKVFGDMSRSNSNFPLHLEKFCKVLGIDSKKTVSMQQVHGNKVSIVSKENLNSIIAGVDGLISLGNNIFLICKSADCVPVLFFDKIKKIFGLAHVGWKGAYDEVIKFLLSKMIDRGSMVKDILIGIGPSIRDCCYNIDGNRIRIFINKFPGWKDNIIKKKGGRKFLSLQNLIKLQAGKEGVSKKNIKDSMICTKDSADFYSFRNAENKNSFERLVGIIGIK